MSADKEATKSVTAPAPAAGNNAIMDFIQAVPVFVWVVIQGWVNFLVQGALWVFQFLRGLGFMRLLFLVSCVGLIVVAFPAWIQYTVDFGGSQTVRVGSNFRALFVLPGFAGLAFAITGLRFRLVIYAFVYLACAAGYGAGYFFPNPVHTDMINPDDYRLTPLVYGYLVPLVGCGIFSVAGLRKALVDWQVLFVPLPIRESDSESRDNLAGKAA